MQEIRRHLMIKRPQFLDNEEKLADAEETRSPHKTHHYPPKGHASRHHKKHDKITHTTIADFIVNTESVTKINTTPRDEKGSTTEEKSDKYSTTTILETSTTETVDETSATTVKPKKSPRRQKTKETPTNRTEIEEDKPQRRRKIHHHRRNNTLLTNSVHDDVLRVTHVNTTYSSSDVTLSMQNPTSRERYNYSHKFTTVPATTEASSTRQETQYSGISRNNNNFNEDYTTELTAATESGTTVTMTSAHVTEVSRINPVIDKSFDQPRNISVISPTTISSVKKYPKGQKNRTSGILGPARIDVTILESPDRKHKQSTVINFN